MSLYNYAEFADDIRIVFGKLSEQLNFQFQEIYLGCYELRNSYSVLRFTYDRGEVGCNIRDCRDSELAFGVFPIFNYLFPDDNSFKDHKNEKPFDQLMLYEAVISRKLRFVLNGDFSWVENFRIEENREKKLSGFVWNNIKSLGNIYTKFKNGDKTWQVDLEEYLLKNNIEL